MNQILIEDTEITDGQVILQGVRCDHIRKVLRSAAGDKVKIGIINGPIGEGLIVSLAPRSVTLTVTITGSPLPPPPTDLILALPRPIMLRRVLAQAASLGVERIFIIKANRVEKSFFRATSLEPDNLRSALLQGLEQSAVDTHLPEVTVHQRFRPFVEDLLPELIRLTPVRLLAHPPFAGQASRPQPIAPSDRVIMAIGPEGGWVDFEIDMFIKQGLTPFTLGERILRVDTAVPALLSQIDLLRRLS